MRLGLAVCLLAVAAGATACGADERPVAAGSPSKPATGLISPDNTQERSNEDASASARANAPTGAAPVNATSHLRPCALVSRTRAAAIIGAPVRRPIEAKQGPTCIYRAQKGRASITLGVQTLDLQDVRKRMRGVRRINVAGHPAYCGDYGQAMLYMPLRGGRVLAISAACAVATRFAAQALQQLD